MKTLVLAALLCAASAAARAETAVSGFTPRFSTKPAYADEPDYRPANRPRHKYEFMIDASPDIGREDEDEAQEPDRPRHRPHHDRHDRRKPHR